MEQNLTNSLLANKYILYQIWAVIEEGDSGGEVKI